MKILDWRPWWVKAGTALWGGPTDPSGEDPASPPSAPTWPASWLGSLNARVMERRVGHRQAPPDGPFVVSIGNLAVGGTGKTPVTLALALELAGRGLKGAVLTRGFGSRLAGPLRVKPDNQLAGDEARLMAGSLVPAGWFVIQARNRQAGLDWLMRIHPELDVVLAEDAHQTADLGRHLDILILDRWVQQEGRIRVVDGPVFPLGPYRESRAGALRADLWLLEGNLAKGVTGDHGGPVATFSRRLALRNPLEGGDGWPDNTGWAALGGIARPGRFERGAMGIIGKPPRVAIRPGDHVAYSPRGAQRIAEAMDEAGADLLVTTAKDWVKLGCFWDARRAVRVVDLTLVWGQDMTLPELVGERLDAWVGRKAR